MVAFRYERNRYAWRISTYSNEWISSRLKNHANSFWKYSSFTDLRIIFSPPQLPDFPNALAVFKIIGAINLHHTFEALVLCLY